MTTLRTLRAPLALLPRALRWRWAALAPLIAATASVELIAAASVYVMVERASAGTLTSFLLVGIAAIFILRNLLQWSVAVLQSGLTADSISAAFRALLGGSIAASGEYHLAHGTAEQTQRLTVAIDTAYRLVLASAAGLVSEATIAVALTALLLVKAPLEAAIAAVILAASLVALLVLTRRSVTKWGAEVYQRGEETLHATQELLGGIREIKTAQAETVFLDRAAGVQKRYTNAFRHHLLALARPRLATETAFVVVAFAFILVLPRNGGLLPLLALFAYVGFRLIPSVNRVIYHLDHIRHGEHAVAELDAAFREVAPFETVERRPRGFDFERAIEIDCVSFSYGARPVLTDFSLTIGKGEWIGLAGENGAGKSTLLDVVAGLLRPASGAVRVDGVPLEQWLATSPPLIGYLRQRPFMFDDTVAHNIALDGGEAAARIDVDLNANATRLSEGEKQRVALSRALHRLPPILLLDEPGTALDAQTEAYFARMLASLKGLTTAIVVSHRPEALSWCDRVVHLSAPAPPPRPNGSDRENAPARTAPSEPATAVADRVAAPDRRARD